MYTKRRYYIFVILFLCKIGLKIMRKDFIEREVPLVGTDVMTDG